MPTHALPCGRGTAADGQESVRSVLRESGLAAIAIAVFTLLIPTTRVDAQQVIFHYSFSSDDGDATRDADGSKNGTVVFSGGGDVHLVYSFEVWNGETLIIQPGAVVKFARSWEVDINGNLVKAVPMPPGAFGDLRTVYVDYIAKPPPVIRIDGASFTDIRDDTIGGDTNSDGDGSSPTGNTFRMAFSGSSSLLTNSTVRFGWIEHPGNGTISGNHFEQFGGICQEALDLASGETPTVSGNEFEIASPGRCRHLNFTGMAAMVTGNTIRSATMLGTSGGAASGGILIGPAANYASTPVEPESGSAIVAENRVEGSIGITVTAGFLGARWREIVFHAEVRSNTFVGVGHTETGGPGDTGLTVFIEADVLFEGNSISGFRTPLRISNVSNGADYPLAMPRLRRNTFSTKDVNEYSEPGISDDVWKTGRFIDAENNDWGDPTGPYDPSNRDGLYNARGKGIRLGNGIDYVPFIGDPGRWEPQIRIDATASTPSPIPTLTDVVVTPRITGLDVGPAGSGTVRMTVRDDQGYVVRSDLPDVQAVAGSVPVLAPFTIQAPLTTGYVTVEATLSPSDGSEAVTSNLVTFRVDRPKSRLSVGIADWGNLNPMWAFLGFPRGFTATFTAKITYTLPDEGGGRIDLVMTEEDKIAGRPLAGLTYSPATLSIQTGSDQTAQQEMTVTIPLRDVIRDKARGSVRVLMSMKNASGTEVARVSERLDINESSNRTKIDRYLPGSMVDGNFAASGVSYHVAGTEPVAQIFFTRSIGTPEFSPMNWELWLDGMALDRNGAVLHRYTATGPMARIYTFATESDFRYLNFSIPFPSGTARFRERLRMWAPDLGLNVAVDSIEIEVRDVATSETQPLPGGAGRVAFSSIPISLDLSQAPASGSLTASEFGAAWAGKGATPLVAAAVGGASGLVPAAVNGASGLSAAALSSDFIPLDRYWAVTPNVGGTFAGTITFGYDPSSDFPPGVIEDSLVVAGYNPLSQSLEVLATTRDPGANTVSAPYETFFETWVVGSRVRAVTGVAGSGVPEGLFLRAPWPNPFNPVMTTEFELPAAGAVRLTVYDAIGRRVADLVDEVLPAGVHRVRWDASGRASGTYWLRLASKQGAVTRGVVLVK